MWLLIALLPSVALAQNTFQNTIFDLPAQLGGEPVGVAAQAQGAPLFVQTADQKPPAVAAPQLPNAVPVAPQAAVTPAPFTFPTLPTVAPFTLPSHPTLAPFTLPTHAPFTFPTHPPLVFPPPSTPAPFVPPRFVIEMTFVSELRIRNGKLEIVQFDLLPINKIVFTIISNKKTSFPKARFPILGYYCTMSGN